MKEAERSAEQRSCLAPGCTSTKLCRAHIFPRGIARTLSRPGGHNRAIRPDGSKPANQPLGAFDTEILCADCDGRLGQFDEYAVRFCTALPTTPAARTGSLFRKAEFDGSRFALAMLAILWRASVSAREEWRDTSLGPYQDRAADALFSEQGLVNIPGFQIVLMRYASSELDARKFIFHPIRIRSGPLNVYVMGVGGFQVLAKFDQRPFNTRLQPYVINGAMHLIVPHVTLEETAEFGLFADAAKAERRRQSAPTPV
jgi:hypothetical protein